MVTSFAELMQVQADVTVATLGAHHSSWNRRYEILPRNGAQVSRVAWDGTIHYTPHDVIDPLHEMFDRAYLQHDDETLAKFREAVRTVLHENIHLLAGPGTSLAFPLDAYEGKAHKVFEEGVTELATQDALNNYIDALGLEEIAPGIRTAQTPNAYAAYVPAVVAFSENLGEDVGLNPEDVVHRMAVVNAAEKFPVAAELLYAKHLRKLVPGAAKRDAVSRIAEAMHAPFAAIHGFDSKDPSDVRMAALAGRSAFEKACVEVETIAEYWSANQELRRTLDAGLGATATLHPPQRDGRAGGGPRADGGDSGRPASWNAGDRQRPAGGPARLSRD